MQVLKNIRCNILPPWASLACHALVQRCGRKFAWSALKYFYGTKIIKPLWMQQGLHFVKDIDAADIADPFRCREQTGSGRIYPTTRWVLKPIGSWLWRLCPMFIVCCLKGLCCAGGQEAECCHRKHNTSFTCKTATRTSRWIVPRFPIPVLGSVNLDASGWIIFVVIVRLLTRYILQTHWKCHLLIYFARYFFGTNDGTFLLCYYGTAPHLTESHWKFRWAEHRVEMRGYQLQNVWQLGRLLKELNDFPFFKNKAVV